MEYVEEIESPLPPAKARDALVLYFQKLNYQPSRPTFLNDIEMRRGFAAPFTGFAVSPRGWKVVFEAQVEQTGEGSKVRVKWSITTLGQVCSSLDIKYWKAEANGVRELLQGREVDEVGIERLHARVLLASIGFIIGSMALFVVAWLLLLMVTTMVLSLAIAAALTAAFLWLLRAPRNLES